MAQEIISRDEKLGRFQFGGVHREEALVSSSIFQREGRLNVCFVETWGHHEFTDIWRLKRSHNFSHVSLQGKMVSCMNRLSCKFFILLCRKASRLKMYTISDSKAKIL